MKLLAALGQRNAHQWLRDLGYSPNDNASGEANYVRRLRPRLPWPRYHLYVRVIQEGIELNLHLDQKQETRHYNAASAHNGEYDGPLVEQEINRLKQAI